MAMMLHKSSIRLVNQEFSRYVEERKVKAAPERKVGIDKSKMGKLTANLKRRHDFPTPESPISKSLNR